MSRIKKQKVGKLGKRFRLAGGARTGVGGVSGCSTDHTHCGNFNSMPGMEAGSVINPAPFKGLGRLRNKLKK